MKTPQILRWLVALTCLAAPHLLAAQTTAASSGSLHIGVFIEDGKGSPISYLSAKNFAVSNQGAPLPFHIVRPVLHPKKVASNVEPTRMLILLSPNIKDSGLTLNHLLPELDPIWQCGWQIAAILSNGSRTDYATSAAQLQQMWTTSENNTPPPGPKSSAQKAAVRDLDSFAGHRIVLYLANTKNQQAKPSQRVISAAQKVMAQIFVVDGGVRQEGGDSWGSAADYGGGHERGQGLEPSPDSIAIASSSNPIIKHVSQYESNMYLAVDAHTAIREALHSAGGYYSLRIPRASLAALPSGTPLSIKIHLFDVPNFTATAIGYGNNPPAILLSKK